LLLLLLLLLLLFVRGAAVVVGGNVAGIWMVRRGQRGRLAAGRSPSAGLGIGGGYRPVHAPMRRRLVGVVVHGRDVVGVVHARVRPGDTSQRQRAAGPGTVALGLNTKRDPTHPSLDHMPVDVGPTRPRTGRVPAVASQGKQTHTYIVRFPSQQQIRGEYVIVFGQGQTLFYLSSAVTHAD